jgi:hypothetical protein
MSSVVRTAVIAAYPVLLADMKNFLRLPAAVITDDTLIASLIKAATVQAETITDSILVRSTFVQYMDKFPHWGMYDRGFDSNMHGHRRAFDEHHTKRGEIKIIRTPLISVQSLTYIGTDELPHTLTPGTDFLIDPAKQPGRIRPIPFTTWPLTQRTLNAIAIAFTAGYAPAATSEPETVTEGTVPTPPEQQASYTVDWTLPPTVAIAIMQLVSHWYFNREPVTPGSVATVPLHVLDLLATVSVPDYAPTLD